MKIGGFEKNRDLARYKIASLEVILAFPTLNHVCFMFIYTPDIEKTQKKVKNYSIWPTFDLKAHTYMFVNVAHAKWQNSKP